MLQQDVPQFPKQFPNQHQPVQPGIESAMDPPPVYDFADAKQSGILAGSTALITGGDSGIGRAVAVAFAKEGADVSIVYLNEHEDAQHTKEIVEGLGRRCLLYACDVGDEDNCIEAVERTIKTFGQFDILVNNAAEQHPQEGLEYISKHQLESTFQTNVFSFFYMTKAALKHFKAGSTIINTTSVTAYEGNKSLIDYSATKGAIVTFTRSLALSLAPRQIRVNAVAPGPIWTPLIPSTFVGSQITGFGADTPLGRAGQPVEVAPAYVYLASRNSTYVTGQVMHVNGGTIVGS